MARTNGQKSSTGMINEEAKILPPLKRYSFVKIANINIIVIFTKGGYGYHIDRRPDADAAFDTVLKEGCTS
jgi:hypothetical protein